MVIPVQPDRFMEGRAGGLFSFSTEKVVDVVLANTDGGSSSSYSSLYLMEQPFLEARQSLTS